MIGKCPNCDQRIMIQEGATDYIPLGNYRTIKFRCEDGTYFRIACCLDCYDDWDDKQTDYFFSEDGPFADYLRSCYSDYPEARREALVEKFMDNKVVAIQIKEGCAFRSKEKPQVWH